MTSTTRIPIRPCHLAGPFFSTKQSCLKKQKGTQFIVPTFSFNLGLPRSLPPAFSHSPTSGLCWAGFFYSRYSRSEVLLSDYSAIFTDLQVPRINEFVDQTRNAWYGQSRLRRYKPPTNFTTGSYDLDNSLITLVRLGKIQVRAHLPW